MEKIILFFIHAKFTLSDIWNAFWSNPKLILLGGVLLFAVSSFIFSFIYYFQHKWHQTSIVSYQNKTYSGFETPLPAFHFDNLKKRSYVEFLNEMKIQQVAGKADILTWTSFSEDRSAQRQFPQSASWMDEFAISRRRGTSPTDLIEKVFKKYGTVSVKFNFPLNPQLKDVIIIMVLNEYFEYNSIMPLQGRLMSGTLLPEEQVIFPSLLQAAITVENMLNAPKELQLWQISETLKTQANEIATHVKKPERIKNIFYGEVIKAFADIRSTVDFNFETYTIEPKATDFIYMSTMIATNNMPSEVVILSDDARIAVWIQMIFSYFTLAIIVAALLKIFNL